MTNNEANQFAFDSFVTAFSPGNEHLIDQYFDSDLVMFNHSVSKRFDLDAIKSRLPNIYNKYQDLQSEIKEVVAENERIAFHVQQKAFSVPDNKYIMVNVMSLYKLSGGKVKEWQIWENFGNPKIEENR